LSLSITNAATLHWPAKRGVSYDVQHSTNLVSWMPVDTVLAESNGVAGTSIAGLATNRQMPPGLSASL